MKSIFISMVLISIFSNDSHAQIQASWIGGYPSRPRDWNCSANWSNNKVPNEFTDVHISNVEAYRFQYPVEINSNVVVHSLSLNQGAYICIEKNANLKIINPSSSKLILKNIIVKGSLNLPLETKVSDKDDFNFKDEVSNYIHKLFFSNFSTF